MRLIGIDNTICEEKDKHITIFLDKERYDKMEKLINLYDDFFKLINLLDFDWSPTYSKNVIKIKKWLTKNRTLFNGTIYENTLNDVERFLDINTYKILDFHMFRYEVLKVKLTKHYFVYKHYLPDGYTYVGVTCQKDLDYRWMKGAGYNKNKEFWSLINKYGWDSIKSEIVYSYINAEVAKVAEVELIKQDKELNSKNLNIDKGGNFSIEREGIWGYDYLYQYRCHRRPFKIIVPPEDRVEFKKYVDNSNDKILHYYELEKGYRLVYINHVTFKQERLNEFLVILKEAFYKECDTEIEYVFNGYDGFPMSYDRPKNKILINLSIVDDRDYSVFKTLFSLAHEFRHIIQCDIIEGIIKTSRESDKIILSFKEYIVPTSDNNEEYLRQPLELDANAFAEAVMQKILNKDNYKDFFSVTNFYEEINCLNEFCNQRDLIIKDCFKED